MKTQDAINRVRNEILSMVSNDHSRAVLLLRLDIFASLIQTRETEKEIARMESLMGKSHHD